MPRRSGWVAICFFSMLAVACDQAPVTTGSSATAASQFPNFNYLALGDSLTHGVQDATINQYTQPHSYAVLIAKQLASVYGTELSIPMLDTHGARSNPDRIPTILGISGEDSFSMLQPNAKGEPLSAQSSLEEKTLAPLAGPEFRATPTSQLDAALFLAEQWKGSDPNIPKLITLYLGNNDVLGSIVREGEEDYTMPGLEARLTRPEDFRKNMETVFAALSQTGALIFVATLPDITQIAYLAPKSLLERWTLEEVPETLVPVGSRLSLAAVFYSYADFLSGRDWQETLAEYLTDASIMSVEEQNLLRARIEQFNQAILELSGRYGFTLVRLDQKLKSPQVIEGIAFSQEWGFGKFFSLDGVHFSHSGHAVLANLFLEAINGKLNAQIPLLSVAQVAQNDPYQDVDGDGFPLGPQYDPEDEFLKILFQLRDSDDQDPMTGILGLKKPTKALKSLRAYR